MKNIVFIIGCGRSGTTLLGRILSQHREILYLNEPRDLWHNAYPQTDIWSKNAEEQRGKLILSYNDEDSKKSMILREAFQNELTKSNKKILIEKLPINAFRLDLINKIFPKARYIHIYRNGLEVASSIEERCINGFWFGKNKYKWLKLVEYSDQFTGNIDLAKMCNTYFEKGLLEWRLSTETIIKFLSKQNRDNFIEVSYNSLIRSPINVINKILLFLDILADPIIENYAKDQIYLSNPMRRKYSLNLKNSLIGGKLLLPSMNTCRKDGLVLFHNDIMYKEY